MHSKAHVGLIVLLAVNNKHLVQVVISYYVLLYKVLEGKYVSDSGLVKPHILDLSCYHCLVIYDHYPQLLQSLILFFNLQILSTISEFQSRSMVDQLPISIILIRLILMESACFFLRSTLLMRFSDPCCSITTTPGVWQRLLLSIQSICNHLCGLIKLLWN